MTLPEQRIRQLPLSERLSRFLQFNPSSSIKNDAEGATLLNPWNDDSLEIRISQDEIALIDALNQLILPPTLTAIYHTDSLQLEFIFSVRPNDDPLRLREFDFTFRGTTIHCRYAPSSQRLLLLAAAITPRRPMSATSYRNLRIFSDFARAEDLPETLRTFFADRAPLSFFIGPINIKSSDEIHDLARHLNFHMFYFDRSTPQIIIHSPEATQPAIYEEAKGEAVPFPASINANPIDVHVLDLWGGAHASSGRLAFLYYYQILEYAAFYFLEEQVRLDIARILRRPDILSSLDACLPLLVDELVEYRQSDEHKLAAVIQRSVDPGKVWAVISRCLPHLSEPIDFDGGFVHPVLARPDWGSADFATAWIPKLPDALRRVRNALVHSREYRLGHTIAPTRANLERLQPWVLLVEEVASQVALYRNV